MTTSAPPLIPGEGGRTTTVGVAALALSLLRATQAATVACLPWVGRDDPKAVDGAAVAALRECLGRIPGQCRVVIGEGEKDDAPMLYQGEVLGTGAGPACDLAVDPLEGTCLCARGQDGAVSVIAAAPPGSLLATPGWYMEKLVVGPAATGAVWLDRPVGDNLTALGRALGKPVRLWVSDKQGALQTEVTDKLEGKLGDVKSDLDQAVNRVTAEALKRKAAQLGTIALTSSDCRSASNLAMFGGRRTPSMVTAIRLTGRPVSCA